MGGADSAGLGEVWQRRASLLREDGGMPIRGRLAPSPTGALHLGNARSFLLAWLAVRARGGAVVMRVEDLDGPRLKAGAEREALDDLRWLGLDWDEGPDVGGRFGPYRQTERLALYRAALDRLVRQGLAYPCVCTRAEVERAASAPHAGEHETPYPGTCHGRFATVDEAERATGRPASLRFRVEPQEVAFVDELAGSVRFDPARECGDFVIEKVERSGPKAGLRTPAYQLACVVDDDAMEIDTILRGDDLLASTARQRLLQRALGLRQPSTCHAPLLVGEDGRRLAKRHGDTTLRRFREAGVPPQRLVGWLALRSGLLDELTDATPRELLERFDLARLPRGATVVRGTEITALLGDR